MRILPSLLEDCCLLASVLLSMSEAESDDDTTPTTAVREASRVRQLFWPLDSDTLLRTFQVPVGARPPIANPIQGIL